MEMKEKGQRERESPNYIRNNRVCHPKIKLSMLIVVVQSNFFTLPISEAQELLLLLSHQEITGATVYPGYAGAAKACLKQNIISSSVQNRG
jgi:hypothetical protein